MAKITYDNKVALNPQPSIADINKVTDADMNEIKQVVNENAVEIGSNSNGSWIKYENGTMICTNRVSQTKNIDGQFESSYFTSIDRVNFPQEFISEPYVTAALEQNGALLSFNFTSIDTTSFGGYIWKQQAKNNVNVKIHYIAIGRWK